MTDKREANFQANSSQHSIHLPSIIFSTPSFSSTLPIPRSTSASRAFRHGSGSSRRRHPSDTRRARSRSVGSSASHLSDGSLGDFSMENYTIDLAQLATGEVGARLVESQEKAQSTGNLNAQKQACVSDENEEDVEDFMGGYTIDLDALEDKPSSVIVRDRDQQRVEIASEDDGPEDFTLNLEKWMRGTGKWEKPHAEDVFAEDGDMHQDDIKEEGESQINHGDQESTFEPQGMSTPAPFKTSAIIEKVPDEESGASSPDLDPEAIKDQKTEEVLVRIAALQAELEMMRVEDDVRQASLKQLGEENKRLKMQNADMRTQLHERNREPADDPHAELAIRELSTLRTQAETEKREFSARIKTDESDLQVSRDESRTLRMESGAEKQALNARIEALEMELQVSRDESQTFRKDTDAERRSSEMKIRALETDLQNSRDKSRAARSETETQQRSSDLRIKALENELQASRDESRNVHMQKHAAEDSFNAALENLKVELERKNTEKSSDNTPQIRSLEDQLAASLEINSEKQRVIDQQSKDLKTLNTEVDQLHGQLQETRRIVETVEEENDGMAEENETQAQELSELNDRLKVKSVEVQAAHATIAKLREIAQNVDPLPKDAEEGSNPPFLEGILGQHQATLTSIEETHAQALKRLVSGMQKATQNMKKREARLTRTYTDKISSLQQELANLKYQQEQAQQQIKSTVRTLPDKSNNDDIEIELRSAIRALSTKLSKATTALASARAETEAANSKAQEIEQTNMAVNAEMERRFADSVERREREWMRRVELLLRDRDKMGKALLHGWGKEEMGQTKGPGGQEYRYKYVKGRF